MAVPHGAPTRRSFDRRASDRRTSGAETLAPTLTPTRRSFDRRGSDRDGHNGAFLSAIPTGVHQGAPTRRSSGKVSPRGVSPNQMRRTSGDGIEETDSFDPESNEMVAHRSPRKLMSQYSMMSTETVATVGSVIGESPQRRSSGTKNAVGSSQPKRLDSVMSMNPDAKRIYQMMIGDRPNQDKLAPGKAEKLKGDVTSLLWTIPATAQYREEDTSSSIDPKEIKKPILPIFSHQGVWVRPSSVGSAIAPLQHLHAHPIEEHACVIDGTVQLDTAHAILAFDFIDCINDDVLHHYLPMIDKTLSQDLGLNHNVHRLAVPNSERVQAESVGESYDCGYSESYEQSYDHSSSNEYGQVRATSGTPTKEQGSWVDSCDDPSEMHSRQSWWETEQMDYTEEPYCASDIQTPRMSGEEVPAAILQRTCSQQPEDDSLKQELSQDPTTAGPSLDAPVLEESSSHSGSSPRGDEEMGSRNDEHKDSRREVGTLSSTKRPSKIVEQSYGGDFLQIETVNSAEAQVWPHACSIYPKCLSQTRSEKLRAVDSMPVRAFEFPDSKAGTPSQMESPFQTIRGEGWPMLGNDSSLRSPRVRRGHDPASITAPVASVYSPGASRVRGLGQWQRSGAKQNHLKNAKRRPKHGPPSMLDTSSTILPEREDDGLKAPGARRRSKDSKASIDAVQASGLERGNAVQGSASSATTSADAKSPSARKDEDPLMSNDSLGDLLSKNLQSVPSKPPYDRSFRELYSNANPTCPFSHDSLDSSVSITLRCGHRFALSQMEIARRGPSICASAGFASKDAVICPLCGDQDITTTPEGSKMLTTYSTNTAAYLGELRKDWQWNLLPLQEPTGSLTKDSEDLARKCESFLPAISSARKAQ